MQQLSALQLNDWLKDTTRPQPQLLDVRETWEFALCHITNSVSLPLSRLPAHWMEFDRETPCVMICHHGARSFQAGLFLEQQGFSNIINLQGGVAAWAQQIDPAMPKY